MSHVLGFIAGMASAVIIITIYGFILRKIDKKTQQVNSENKESRENEMMISQRMLWVSEARKVRVCITALKRIKYQLTINPEDQSGEHETCLKIIEEAMDYVSKEELDALYDTK